MPIDPFTALNAMLRAEVARSSESEERHPDEAEPESPGTAPDGRRPTHDDIA
jgi:hypothetical protein